MGQPRDGDPRAAYAIVDVPACTQIELIRRAYPVQAAQDKIREAGLPDPLADRLAAGTLRPAAWLRPWLPLFPPLQLAA